MLENVQKFWQQRSRKDQLYLIIGAVVVIAVLSWVLLCKPLIDWRDKERQKVVNLTRTLATVESLVGRVRQQAQEDYSGPGNGTLADIVDVSLRDNNLRMKGFQPGTNSEARLDLEDANYQPLMQWLYDLEYQYDVQILELNVARTQTIGALKVSLRLKKV
jgi:general secretion pathway protein M